MTLSASIVPAQAADTAAVVTPDVNPSVATATVSAPAVAPTAPATNAPAVVAETTATAPAGAVPVDTAATATLGYDYISLPVAASTIGGEVYLPLRATFLAMKSQAMQLVWKVDGTNKIKLTNGTQAYEIYLGGNGTSIHLQQGDAGYPLKIVNGTSYVPLRFFQDIVHTSYLGLSGTNLLVLIDKGMANGQATTDIWSNPEGFWGNLNGYQATQPAPQPAAPAPVQVSKPVTTQPTPQKTTAAPAVSKPAVTTQPAAITSVPIAAPTYAKPAGNIIPDTLIWPTLSKQITSPFGYRPDPFGGSKMDFHTGTDIAGNNGTPVFAAQQGKIIRAEWYYSYGNCIDVQHPSGLVTRYAHLSAYAVKVGQTVKQGQQIGNIGSTGASTGPHLHFETIVNGKAVDSANYFKK